MLGFTPASPGASRPHPYTVRSGDTLWSIAARHYPNSDPREAVYRIEQANHLGQAGLVAGETDSAAMSECTVDFAGTSGVSAIIRPRIRLPAAPRLRVVGEDERWERCSGSRRFWPVHAS